MARLFFCNLLPFDPIPDLVNDRESFCHVSTLPMQSIGSLFAYRNPLSSPLFDRN